MYDAIIVGARCAGVAPGHKNPILAQGISGAFPDATFLAAAIHDGLSGAQALDRALAEYERMHMEASMPLFELSCDFAPYSQRRKGCDRSSAR